MCVWLLNANLSRLPHYTGKQVIIVFKKVYKIRVKRFGKIVVRPTIIPSNKEIYVLGS